MIKSLADVAAGWLGFQGKKLDLENSVAVQAAAAARAEAAARDKTRKAIAQKDTQEIRDELAE